MADQYIKVGHQTVGTDVSGPGSTTDTAVVRWSGTAGNTLLNSGVLIDGSNNVTGVAALTTTGQIRFPAGTETAPGISVSTGVEQTGLYRAGTNLGVTIGGVAAITFKASAGDITIKCEEAATKGLYINKNNTDGILSLSADAGGNFGRNISMFGSAHATTPNEFQIRRATTVDFSISATGKVGISAAPNAAATLNTSNASGNTGAAQYGILNSFIGANDATTAIYGLFCGTKSPNNAATYTLLVGIRSDVEAQAASTVTRKISCYITSTAGGTVSNQALLSDNAVFTGDYALNISSTNQSMFAGKMAIAGTVSANALLVVGSASTQTLITGTSQYGAIIQHWATPAATSNICGILTNVRAEDSTVGAPYTTTNMQAILVNAFAKGTFQTITYGANIRIADAPLGSNTAVFTDASTWTGDYALYLTTAKNSRFHGAIQTIKNDIASAANITALDSVHGFVKLTGVTATTLDGIAAGKDGQRLTLFNNSGQILTIKHQSGSAAAADQITTMTGADVVTVGNGCAEFIYDVTDTKWINTNTNP